MAETLNEVERRVLGVLLEKSLAQPQYYPMTLNAIAAACNQKSNRDPVMELDEDAVWNTLEVLRAAGLVSRVLPAGPSRVERYKHEAKEFFAWEKPQRAVMAELLLRGPQTVAELRARCERMYPFENTEGVTAVLEGLQQSDPPRVAPLPRTPGQSAVRCAHRLYSPQEWAALAASEPGPAGATPPPTGPTPQPAAACDGGIEDLRAEIGNLHEELASLRDLVEKLRQRIDGRGDVP
jgi:hypothetical protein